MEMSDLSTSSLKLLRGCLLFSRLSEGQLEALSQHLRPLSFPRHTLIFQKGDPGDALYLIGKGRVKISVLNSDGKDLILNIYGLGEVFGELSLFDGLPRSASAMTLSRVEAWMLTRAEFEALLGGVPGLAASIIALLSRRLRYTTEQTEMLGLLDAYDRVAFKLLQMAQEDEEGRPTVLLSQHELAAMLGLTREWLNKVLNTLAGQGVIEITRGKIVLLRPSALQSWF